MAQNIYGNNRIFCKGRLISGPDSRSCIATAIMIWVPAIVWQVVVGAYFANGGAGGIILPILVGLLQLSSLAFLLATAFSDPGIMPRQKDYTEQYDKRTGTFRTKQPPRYHEVLLKGHPFKLKFCTTCGIYRPPRCTHCSVCENCIERFDHHCPWIGNCIGKRNYWLFYCFIVSTGLLNALVLATSFVHLGLLCASIQAAADGMGTGEAILESMRQDPLTAALIVYCTGIVWFTVGLCLYHNYLVCTNQTTYEQIKGVYGSGSNPFNKGILGNYLDVLGSRVRPRYFDPYTGRMIWPDPQAGGSQEVKPGPIKPGKWKGAGGYVAGGDAPREDVSAQEVALEESQKTDASGGPGPNGQSRAVC